MQRAPFGTQHMASALSAYGWPCVAAWCTSFSPPPPFPMNQHAVCKQVHQVQCSSLEAQQLLAIQRHSTAWWSLTSPHAPR
jgi:hypothetical protein